MKEFYLTEMLHVSHVSYCTQLDNVDANDYYCFFFVVGRKQNKRRRSIEITEAEHVCAFFSAKRGSQQRKKQTDDDQRKQREDLTKSSMMCVRSREERDCLPERRHEPMGTSTWPSKVGRLVSSSQRSAGAVGRKTRPMMDRQCSGRHTSVIAAAAAAAENVGCTLASSAFERGCTGWIIREQSKSMTTVRFRMTNIQRTCASAMERHVFHQRCNEDIRDNDYRCRIR